jgi:hypothetical protein
MCLYSVVPNLIALDLIISLIFYEEYNYEVKEDEIGRACSTNVGEEECI